MLRARRLNMVLYIQTTSFRGVKAHVYLKNSPITNSMYDAIVLQIPEVQHPRRNRYFHMPSITCMSTCQFSVPVLFIVIIRILHIIMIRHDVVDSDSFFKKINCNILNFWKFFEFS